MSRGRVLLAITVYNGWSFVPRAVQSATRVDRAEADVDILVLDDASPEPGFSEHLEAVCAELGVGYYRSPRNLGIVRNVNLGLRRGLQGGYDHVIIANSDVIFPSNLITSMLRVIRTDETIGSVTAWSNNVSAYSLPNDDPDCHLADQGVVDWISAALDGQFMDGAMDVPAGISFCIMIPTGVLADVGLMDPVFGRGYCEETDWSLRSKALGYRIVVAPSAFVYHSGRGSTEATGMLAPGHTTVPANEKIIDLRYPLFRSQIAAFIGSDILETARDCATDRIIADAARTYGYSIHVSWLHRTPVDADTVRCLVHPDGRHPVVETVFKGFRNQVAVGGERVVDAIRGALGDRLIGVSVFDRGSVGDELRQALPVERINDRAAYPERV